MRLIDADLLIKTLQEREDAPPGWEGATFKDAFSIAIMDIIAQPSVDAGEVIRCRNCEHWTPDWIDALAVAETGICARTVKQTWDCDFCSRAERRDTEK